MNNIELQKKVNAAMRTLIKEKGCASPAEVLIAIGVLSKQDYENWRFGRVPYLEKACKINLSKLSTINHEIRAYATRAHLKASWTAYMKWGNKKGQRKIRIQFSKSGDEKIERLYATHYVSASAARAANERKEHAESSDNSECDNSSTAGGDARNATRSEESRS